MTVNIVIADKHTIIRRGILSMIHSMPLPRHTTGKITFNVIADTDSPDKVCTLLSRHQIDILLLGYTLNTRKSHNPISDLDGISMVKWLAQKFPDTRIVVLSPYRNSNIIYQVLQAGANGYISRESCEHTLWQAITSVRNGETYIEPSLMNSLFRDYSPTGHELSSRENEVLRMLCSGLSLTNIAAKLNLSKKTISAHKIKAMEKLGVKNDCQLYCLLTNTHMFDISL